MGFTPIGFTPVNKKLTPSRKTRPTKSTSTQKEKSASQLAAYDRYRPTKQFNQWSNRVASQLRILGKDPIKRYSKFLGDRNKNRDTHSSIALIRAIEIEITGAVAILALLSNPLALLNPPILRLVDSELNILIATVHNMIDVVLCHLYTLRVS